MTFQQRTTLNGSTSGTTTASLVAPYWLKIIKDGTLVSTYRSPDNVTWTYVGSVLLTLTTPVNIGFAVTSHSSGTSCTATFDNITLNTPTSFKAPTPWLDQDLGTPGVAGAAHLENGLWALLGSGTAIGGTADSGHIAYQPLSGNGMVMAKVTALSSSSTVAGVAIRQSMATGDAEATVLLKNTTGVTFNTRSASGGSTTTVAGVATSAPYWVKLVRNGNMFYGYESADGLTWTLISSLSVTMTGTVYAGVVMTSGVNTAEAQASLSSVQVIPLGTYLQSGSVSSGALHNLYLQQNGAVWAWGSNVNGQVGDGTTTQRNSPVQITTLSGMAQVSAGTSHSLALKNDGTVWAWGLNSNGQVGDNTTTQRTAPVQVTTLSSMMAVSAGNNFSLGLKNDGTVWSWGLNSNGQLGDGTTTQRNAPVQLTTLSNIVAISAGGTHSMALKADGTVWVWGNNATGQLGDGTTTQHTSPEQLTALTNFAAISAGTSHSLALNNDGTIWAWGHNGSGEIGDGTTTERNSPVHLTLSGMVSVRAGNLFSEAIKNDGTLWVWGANTSGQLGDGTSTSRSSPEQLTDISGVTTVGTGTSHTIVITSDATIWGWGANASGQLGDGTTISDVAPESSYNPSVPTSGLAAWFKADADVTVDGSNNVSQWLDQSSHELVSTQTTAGAKPVLVTNVSNGQPALSFNGSMYLSGTNSLAITGTSGTTLITVASTTAPTDQRYSFTASGTASAGVTRNIGYYNSQQTLGICYSDPTAGTSPPAGIMVADMATLGTNGSSVTFYRNGTQTGTGTASGTTNVPAGFTVGSFVGGTYNWKGNISEILAYNRVLTSTELQAVGVYLANKYGLYNPNATWPSSYSTAVQAEITRNQWNKNQADAYVALQAANPSMLTNGLAAWYKADAGLTLSGSNVTGWADQTGNSPVIQTTGANQPTYVASDSNGMPGLRFSGNQQLSNLRIMGPGFAADMTMIEVGSPSASTSGELAVWLGNTNHSTNRGLGYTASAQYFETFANSTAAGSVPNNNTFVADTVSLNSTLTSVNFYRNGLSTGTNSMGGILGLQPGLAIGGIPGYGVYWQGDISEVLIYDHQLNSTELQQVGVYLANKYGLYNPNATWPSSYTSAVQAEITRNQWNKNQADAYVAFQAANPSMLTNGLASWFKADAGLTLSGSNVTGWTDQTGNNSLSQATSGAQPTYIASDINSKPALHFSGSQLMTNLNSVGPGLNADMTMIEVGSTSGPTSGELAVWLGNTNHNTNRGLGYTASAQYFETFANASATGSIPNANTFVTDAVSLNSSLTSVNFYRNGVASGTTTMSGILPVQPSVSVGGIPSWGVNWQGDIAEVLIYDHQLTSTELQQVGVYLANKYALYNPNATWPSTYSTAVQAEITRNRWNKSQADAYVAMQSANPTVLTNGLTAWYKADAGVTLSGSNVTTWADQTGNYFISQGTTGAQPIYVSSDVNGKPALRFSGGQLLNNPGSMGVGMNSDMTIIEVGSTSAPTAAQFAVWLGNTSASVNRGLGYASSEQYFDSFSNAALTGSSPIAHQFVVDEISLNPTLTSINFYRNESLSGTASMSGIGSQPLGISVGGIPGYGLYWQGDIAEVLMYDHQLSTAELQQIGAYLAGKYNLDFLTTAPVITPNGGSFSSSSSVTMGPALPSTVIRYTLDGTNPTLSSPIYTTTLNLTQSCPLNAAYFINYSEVSPVASAQFDVADTGSIGISDAWQNLYFGHTGIIPTADPLNSGLTYLQKYLYGYDPTKFSSNSDGLSDLVNYELGISGTNYHISADGLTNAQNLALGIDPFNTNEAPVTPPATNPMDHVLPVITLKRPSNATLLP